MGHIVSKSITTHPVPKSPEPRTDAFRARKPKRHPVGEKRWGQVPSEVPSRAFMAASVHEVSTCDDSRPAGESRTAEIARVPHGLWPTR